MTNNKGTVVVGLSGGVDSAVSAALLLEEGFQVIGVSLSLWKAGYISADSDGQYREAQKVAEHLGIPWLLIDRQQIFRDTVVAYYLQSLKDGRTPNPCIVCNKVMKWQSLLEVAQQVDAAYVATGHYARRHIGSTVEIHKAKDRSKDQTYFLAMLGQMELSKTLFPLGEYLKGEVRSIALEKKIPVATRPESQDLCFLGNMDQKAFINTYAQDLTMKGEIIHFDGHILGEHHGLAGYTVGQRKGIQIAYPFPLYVIKKDLSNNRLIVGEREYLGTSRLTARDVNWLSDKAPGVEFNASVKIRYGAPARDASIKLRKDGKLDVTFDQKIRDITPGQAMVMYQNENCLGMGFIE